jgi:hypothetical protein
MNSLIKNLIHAAATVLDPDSHIDCDLIPTLTKPDQWKISTLEAEFLRVLKKHRNTRPDRGMEE